MAKYILVEFEEDSHATNFLKKMNAAAQAGRPFGVVGVFQKPTEWCECDVAETRYRHELRKGKKFGWTIHTKCRKARRGAQTPINLLGGEYTYKGVRVKFDMGADGKILRNFPLTLTKVGK